MYDNNNNAKDNFFSKNSTNLVVFFFISALLKTHYSFFSTKLTKSWRPENIVSNRPCFKVIGVLNFTNKLILKIYIIARITNVVQFFH